MANYEEIEYDICESCLQVIVNDDFTGLEDDEYKRIKKRVYNMPILCLPVDSEQGFRGGITCECCGSDKAGFFHTMIELRKIGE